jgi:hypothetical protein
MTVILSFQAGVLPGCAASLVFGAVAGFASVFFVAELLPPGVGQAGTAVFGVLLALELGWLGRAVWQLG